jgi:hypothetical protein
VKTEYWLQHPATTKKQTLEALLSTEIEEQGFNSCRVAVAYMTVAGVRKLLDMFPGGGPQQSAWLIGLDDAITHPDAIDLLLKMNGTEVQVVSHASSGLRFHPKVFELKRIAGNGSALSLIGSANLTRSALSGNTEAVVAAWCASAAEKADMGALWNELWRLGHKPSPDELRAYRRAFKIAQRQRCQLGIVLAPAETNDVLASDAAELDPAAASTCWIECGKITAQGREIEFKAEQALFFGLNPHGEDPRVLPFRLADRSLVDLRMKYQGNHMWRLQLTGAVPEVRAGLRPRLPDGSLGRSPYVAVFHRSHGAAFGLEFLKVKSRSFRALYRATQASGTVGRTSAREYGWC